MKKLNATTNVQKESSVKPIPFGRSQSYNPVSKTRPGPANGTSKRKVSPKRKKSSNKHDKHDKITITSSLSFQEETIHERGLERSGSSGKENEPKV